VFDLDCDQGRWFMSMELLEGSTLAQLLHAGPVPEERARSILRQCAEALSFAHERGIAHGDLKPANIFVTGNDEIHVLDFGAAADEKAAVAHLPAASARYASPEVAAGLRPEVRD